VAIDGVRALRRTRRRRESISLAMGFYLVGLLVFGVTVALSGTFFDRYLLPVLPFLLLAAVRGSRSWGKLAWGFSVAALVTIFTFSALLKLDAMDHTTARFQAGKWLIDRGALAGVGLDYNRGVWAGDWPYQVADVPLPNFRVEATFPYVSRLSGFTTRYVLAQARNDTPPLRK
jgi:hypothetical protein